jgi:hypothetical protein
MLLELTVILFVTVVLLGAVDAWPATVSTPQCGELSHTNARQTVITNTKKSAAHASRDLLREPVTSHTYFSNATKPRRAVANTTRTTVL